MLALMKLTTMHHPYLPLRGKVLNTALSLKRDRADTTKFIAAGDFCMGASTIFR